MQIIENLKVNRMMKNKDFENLSLFGDEASLVQL